jgi:hypothetical protein
MPYQEIDKTVLQKADDAVSAITQKIPANPSSPIPFLLKGKDENAVGFYRGSPTEFFKDVSERYDVAVIAEGHYRENFELLGQQFKAFKEANFEAVFIEVSKNKQGWIDDKVASALPPNEKNVNNASFGSIFEPIFYQSKNQHIPLIGMDKNDVKDYEGLGVGNDYEQKIALNRYIAKHGVEQAEEMQKKFWKERMDANDDWLKNISEYVSKHHIKKFIIIGGKTHMERHGGISGPVAKATGLKTVDITLSHEKNIIEPLITKGRWRPDGKSSDEVSDYRISFPQLKLNLSNMDIKLINKQYDFIYDLPKDSSCPPEWIKFNHGLAISQIDSALKLAQGIHENGWNDLEKLVGNVSPEDRILFKNMEQNLVNAREGLNTVPPNFSEAAKNLYEVKKNMENTFCGGTKKIGELCYKNRKQIQNLMTTPSQDIPSILELVNEANHHIYYAQSSHSLKSKQFLEQKPLMLPTSLPKQGRKR